ncbi:MAG: enoyl-CoA hydratase/isomerase family protein [Planctomycetota bacterium]|jgi:enoyl-CoA hydratase/carnithine racemase
MANDDLVLYNKEERNPAVGVLTLNRPDAGNAFNTSMLEALSGRLDEIHKDHLVRAVILHAVGKHASFGADLNELVVKTDEGYKNIRYKEAYAHLMDGRKVVGKLFNLRVPIVGLMHGFTLGGGAEIFMMCDLLYGATGGKKEGGLLFGFPEAQIGVMAGWMGPEAMVRKIGSSTAIDIFCTGRMIDAEEALSQGIIRKAVPKEQLYEEGFKWADMITHNAPCAVESTRRTVKRVAFPDFDQWLETTAKETIDNLLTDDFLLGAKKILERETEMPKYHRK